MQTYENNLFIAILRGENSPKTVVLMKYGVK